MSKEEFSDFFKTASKNGSLNQRINELSQKYKKLDLSPNETKQFLKEKLIPFAKKENYNFTLQDILNFAKQSQKIGMDKLEKVSGGKFSLKTFGIDALASAIAISTGALTSNIVQRSIKKQSNHSLEDDKNRNKQKSKTDNQKNKTSKNFKQQKNN